MIGCFNDICIWYLTYNPLPVHSMNMVVHHIAHGLVSPWFLPGFTALRIFFLALIVYNSFVLSINFNREVLIPYVFYYCLMIAWIRPFVKGNFNRAVQE